MAKKIIESKTVVIKRSQISLNDYNPKIHKPEDIKKQLRNFRQNGNLGGLVWNRRSGHLISGHKRILALDMYYHYDTETRENDYDVKVEEVDYDRKTELEQMTFMSGVSDTKPDYNMIARYLDDIDPKEVGFTDDEIKQLEQLQDSIDEISSASMEDLGDDLLAADAGTPEPQTASVPQPAYELPSIEKTNDEIVREHEEKPKMTKEQVKAEKQHCQDVADKRWEDVDKYIFLVFDTTGEKVALCDLLGITPTNDMQIKGEDVLRLVE